MCLLQTNLCLLSPCSSATKGKEPGQQEERARAIGGRVGAAGQRGSLGLSAGLCHYAFPESVLCANAAHLFPLPGG